MASAAREEYLMEVEEHVDGNVTGRSEERRERMRQRHGRWAVNRVRRRRRGMAEERSRLLWSRVQIPVASCAHYSASPAPDQLVLPPPTAEGPPG